MIAPIFKSSFEYRVQYIVQRKDLNEAWGTMREWDTFDDALKMIILAHSAYPHTKFRIFKTTTRVELIPWIPTISTAKEIQL